MEAVVRLKISIAPLVLALVLVAVPLAANGQQAPKVYRVGYLGNAPPTTPATAHIWHGFLEGLRDRGYVEKLNLIIEGRYAQGQPERFPGLVAELLALKVDLIVVADSTAAHAAKRATASIPIVFTVIPDPDQQGLVDSLARPGRNITGLSTQLVDLQGKHLELMKEVLPGLARLAVLWTPANPASALSWKQIQGPAKALGLTLISVEIGGPADLEPAFERIARERPDALYPHLTLTTHRGRVMDFAMKHRLPTFSGSAVWAEAGALMTYAADFRDLFRRAATYVDKILKGAKPSDLPVEQPTKFDLVVNIRTAKALGLTIPPSLLLRADQVIGQ